MTMTAIRNGICPTCGWVRDAAVIDGTLYTDLWHSGMNRGKIIDPPDPCSKCRQWSDATPMPTELPEPRTIGEE